MSDMISNAQARRIAADWHGGQASALCALATSGYIDLADARTEISRELQQLDVGEERRELLALDKYVREAGHRQPIDGWSHLWDDTTPVTVDQC